MTIARDILKYIYFQRRFIACPGGRLDCMQEHSKLFNSVFFYNKRMICLKQADRLGQYNYTILTFRFIRRLETDQILHIYRNNYV